jgi:hypothetical protein
LKEILIHSDCQYLSGSDHHFKINKKHYAMKDMPCTLLVDALAEHHPKVKFLVHMADKTKVFKSPAIFAV